MLGIEEIVGEDMKNEKHGLPPGFRFHPTDEELISFYLSAKILKTASSYYGVNIAEVDLNRCEPWELPEEAKMGEREWYFFSLRVRKYPTGLRTNRATLAGYWKATGKDRQIYSASNGTKLGTKKTLVFYKGGAPRGHKTKWVMHEYRLHSDFPCRNMNTCKDEWVLCRIIQKNREKIKPRPLLDEAVNVDLSPSPISLPPLLETTPTTLMEYCESQRSHFQALHNFHHQENDLERLVMNQQLVFQSNLLPLGLQTIMTSFPPSSPSTIIIDDNISHMLSHEGLGFPRFRASSIDSTTGNLMDGIQENGDTNKLGYSVDDAVTIAYEADHDKSNSIACEGYGYHILY